jgi:general secretion pathway protein G
MRQIPQSRNRTVAVDERGRTLTYVLCLLVPAAIVLALVILPPCPSVSHARLVSATIQIKCFETALRNFRNDNGFYPPGTNGLQDLVRQPIRATNWRGPYLDSEVIPKDPWGRAYVYQCPGRHRASVYPYDLLSLGPPGASNPVANWAQLNPTP